MGRVNMGKTGKSGREASIRVRSVRRLAGRVRHPAPEEAGSDISRRSRGGSDAGKERHSVVEINRLAAELAPALTCS